MEIQEFKNKAEAIGKVLNMAVQFPSDEDMRWNKRAHFKNGHKDIRIESPEYRNGKGKFIIAGDFPRTEKGEMVYYGKGFFINVSETKNPEQIARDIERRLLPEYEKALNDVVNRVVATNLYHARQEQNVRKLAQYFNVEFKADRDRPAIYVYDQIPGFSSTIEAYGEDTVKFSLEVTPALAIKIFDLMKVDSAPDKLPGDPIR